jgi:hypothetical protein
MPLAEGVVVRVVRWNHSGDATTNPEQHDPIELAAAPTPDAATGGLRAGVAEDFPNGGGSRGFLFTVEGPRGPFSWFYESSAGVSDLDDPIVLGGVDYGAPLANLARALQAAGLPGVDLWIGTGGRAVAARVLPVLHPKAYLPVHWEGLWNRFEAGLPLAYADPDLEALLASSHVTLLRPRQYMDKWRLDSTGVRPVSNSAVKRALGFADSATFAR